MGRYYDYTKPTFLDKSLMINILATMKIITAAVRKVWMVGSFNWKSENIYFDIFFIHIVK